MAGSRLKSISRKLGLVGTVLAFAGTIGNDFISAGKPQKGNSSGAEITIPYPNHSQNNSSKNLSRLNKNPLTSQKTYLKETAHIYGALHTRTKVFENGVLKSYSIRTDSTTSQEGKEYFIAFYDSQDNPVGYATGKIIDGHMRPREWKRFDTMSDIYDEESAKAQEKKVTITRGANIPLTNLKEFHALRQTFEEAKK
jgi:hypothetical protein